ncbi:kinesin-like nuclear fusion protein [Linnemannia exigua]|uniref:Kinesin-like protein n=1 Tax=Linnemannia exigua TaxID=604196 RepID=A0AAD4D907_9FUNG|nr:kinesin-like nuclear fusion protein [Linnemannia exigua]
MEQLNRSISKLKPPTKITASASSSSTIATALAVAAAAMGGNENKATVVTSHLNQRNHNNNITPTGAATTTVSAGFKRKAEETGPVKRTRPAPATDAKPNAANPSGTNRGPLANAGGKGATGPVKTSAAAATRTPFARTGQRGTPVNSAATSSATTTSRRTVTRAPTPVTSRPPRHTATATTGRTQQSSLRNKTRTQQPSPSASASSHNSEPNISEIATGNTSSSTATTSASTPIIPIIPKKKKRPAWDTKGRLEDMEELTAVLNEHLQTSSSNMVDLTSKLESSESKIAQLESFRLNLEGKVAVKENENKTILQKMQSVEKDLETTAREHEEDMRRLKLEHSRHMDQLKMTQARLQQETESLQMKLQSKNIQLEGQMQENTGLRSTISAKAADCHALESDNQALKTKVERTESTLRERTTTIDALERKLAESQQLVADLEQRIRQEETIRRRLHNTIQELRGNIRVFCRVRPVSSSANSTKKEATTAMIQYPDVEGRQIEFAHSTETATGSQIDKAYPFTFDRVFQPSSTQGDVFEEISQLVQSALDGYNVCIFAYGQTGSGKTHTMEGPLNASSESRGMIPRSVLQIYENAKALEAKGWTYTMEGQYVEIYNETVNDLLGNDGLDSGGGKKHEIRHGANGKTTVTDITTVVLTSAEKVTALLKKAAHNRSVGSTQMNERSSRSHCVFTLRLAGKNSITDESSEGVLNLIDLAGSERLSQSGATGDRLRETQAINKSLSCLGDVIYAIANKDPHVPYRNSKLTYLLQNSLGGNSKTLMFVNISPLKSNFNETLCSLRFATKVNSCTIGTATKRAVK